MKNPSNPAASAWTPSSASASGSVPKHGVAIPRQIPVMSAPRLVMRVGGGGFPAWKIGACGANQLDRHSLTDRVGSHSVLGFGVFAEHSVDVSDGMLESGSRV